MKERVKVYCRIKPEVRPEVDDETHDTFLTGSSYEDSCLQVDPESTGDVTFIKDKNETKTFHFDNLLVPGISQEQVYQKAAFDIIQDVMEGYNGTILAYGQTSTGKTHTMVGREETIVGEERGIIPRCLEDIFNRVQVMSQTSEVCVKVSYVQIYCERIFDLLCPDTNSSSLSIRMDEEKGVYIQGVALAHVKSVEDCFRCIRAGNENRAVAATSMNAHSSRSHAVFIVQIEHKCINTETMTKQIKVSQLHLVDLAGSERVAKSMVQGTRFDELRSINLSLSALGNVVASLAQKKTHIPYRDSKLTRLLQSSLGGNAKTALIVTVSSASSETFETQATLRFGQRCMQVAVKAHLNVQPDYKALYEAVQSHIDKRDDRINELEMELQKNRDKNTLLEEQVNTLKISSDQLEFDLKMAKSTVENHAFAEKQTSDTGNNENLSQKFDTDISKLRSEHMEYIDKLKSQYDKQVAAYKSSSNTASQEWHNIEHELANERASHLDTVKQYRECREKLTKQEIENSDRIAELLQEIEAARKMSTLVKTEFATYKESAQGSKYENMEKSALLEDTETKVKKLESQMREDYVPREQIDEMEKLYSDIISKLQIRVDSLESTKTTKVDPKEQLLKASNKRLTKATPRVGRVQPKRSTNQRFR